MKIEIIPSTVGQTNREHQFCMAVIIDEVIAIDAGPLGMLSPLSRQKRIEHVLLSHSHIDHLATLPVFLNNVYSAGPECVTVYASRHTQECLKTDLFNDRLWPDFFRLADQESLFLRLVTLESEVSLQIAEMRITPVALDHLIPTLGFIVASGDCTVAFVSDTAPTYRIWELLNQTANLKAVFLEASLPNSLRGLAEKARHLCPHLFARELDKLRAKVPVFAYHLHPTFYEQIKGELLSIPRPGVSIAEPGREYVF